MPSKDPPLTEEEVGAVMERELGVPWEDVFGSIDPHPIAAGTIGQVHHATLESGERVVIKVQRPTAQRDIDLDLGLLERLAGRLAARPGSRRVIDVPLLIHQFADSLRRELDFRREAANVKRMAQVLTPHTRLAVPKVYEDYSTSRLLVMQEVGGVRLNEAPPSDARKEAARQLLESYYQQVLVDGFYHADPHPGNLRWWNDKIYFLDLGMVGHTTPGMQENLLKLLLAISEGHGEDAATTAIKIGELRDDFDEAEFRRQVAELVVENRDSKVGQMQAGTVVLTWAEGESGGDRIATIIISAAESGPIPNASTTPRTGDRVQP
jgi:predicted unusual protein kinase regulating ubiquinone biosynthesis (AarF/ABC1/UbiB family)